MMLETRMMRLVLMTVLLGLVVESVALLIMHYVYDILDFESVLAATAITMGVSHISLLYRVRYRFRNNRPTYYAVMMNPGLALVFAGIIGFSLRDPSLFSISMLSGVLMVLCFIISLLIILFSRKHYA